MSISFKFIYKDINWTDDDFGCLELQKNVTYFNIDRSWLRIRMIFYAQLMKFLQEKKMNVRTRSFSDLIFFRVNLYKLSMKCHT